MNYDIGFEENTSPCFLSSGETQLLKNDKVTVLIHLPSGAADVQFKHSSDGRSAIVTYGWPKVTYIMNGLFAYWVKKVARALPS